MQKQEVIILGYNVIGPFRNNETGEIIEGVNVYYIEKEAKDTNRQKGYIPSKIFLNKEKAITVTRNGTGKYNLVYSIDFIGSKPRVFIHGFEFIKKHEIQTV